MTQEQVKALFVFDVPSGNLLWKGSNAIAGFISYSNGSPYLKVCYRGQRYYVHHLIWLYLYGEWPERIDHRDRNSLNNKPANLRKATGSQNMANKERRVHGVEKHGAKFRARIVKDSVRHELGSFATREEAEATYIKAHLEMFGEFSVYCEKAA